MTVNTNYKHHTMSAVENDQFVRLNIEPDMVTEDATYMETKWWDYRAMHPLQATMHFIRVFYAEAAPILTREVSRAAGNQALFRSTTYDLVTQSRLNIRGWWRARMAADAMGVPYETYCRAAIKNFRDNVALMATAKRALTKGTKQELPWPTQLSTPFILKAAITQWEYDREKEFVLPEHDFIRYNPDLWFRTDMEAYLKKEIIRRAAGNRTRAKDIALELVERGLLLPK